MSIDDRIAAMSERSKYQPTVDKGCIGRLLDIHADRADDIRKIVDASWVIGCAKAADLINDEGLGPIGDQAIRRHRRTPPGCSCQTR